MKARTKESGSLVEILDYHDVTIGDVGVEGVYLVRYCSRPETSEFWIFEDNLEFEGERAMYAKAKRTGLLVDILDFERLHDGKMMCLVNFCNRKRSQFWIESADLMFDKCCHNCGTINELNPCPHYTNVGDVYKCCPVCSVECVNSCEKS